MSYDRNELFPVDWNEWRSEWKSWIAEREASGQMAHSSFRFPPANFLADEVLGVWRVSGQTVELSEVTFPDLSPEGRGKRRRYVGVTFGTGAGTVSGGLAETFAELERALELDTEG